MWFKHPYWIPVAWVLSLVNLAAVWFAARPAEPWHATIHALLALTFGIGAQRLGFRRRAIETPSDAVDAPADVAALRGDLAALRQGTLKHVEHAVDAMAIELERIAEHQRFLTKTLAEPAAGKVSTASEPDSVRVVRRPPPNEQ